MLFLTGKLWNFTTTRLGSPSNIPLSLADYGTTNALPATSAEPVAPLPTSVQEGRGGVVDEVMTRLAAVGRDKSRFPAGDGRFCESAAASSATAFATQFLGTRQNWPVRGQGGRCGKARKHDSKRTRRY